MIWQDFAAASFLRGVKLVQIPTSLLAQVDSSVGGKVAVDLPQGKNLVGAFYHPKLVLIDPDVLDTLPPHFISDGMGEVIKYGCIKDSSLFDQLCAHTSFKDLKPELTEIIARCVDIKRIVVEADQFDIGERMLLNFGHTLAHTIEQYYHYERGKSRRSRRHRHVSDHKDCRRKRADRARMWRKDKKSTGNLRAALLLRTAYVLPDRSCQTG